MPLRVSWIKICSFWLYFWCFWTVVLDKTLKSLLNCKKIQPVHPKGDQFWIYIGKTEAEAETLILWPSDVKNWLIWKDSFYYYYYYYLLYNIVLVLPYINMHPPRVYTCSPSWTLLPPPSPYHPYGSSQCTSPKLPVSCIKFGLVIRFLYDIIYVLMPFSQIIPLLSHRVQKTVLYICVSFAVSHTGLSLPSF